MFTKQLLQQHKLKPKKYLGQNFLIDKNILQKIIKTADISPQDTILEIGPGLGIITKALSEKAKKVIAVEKDKNLVIILKEILKDCKNVKIVQGDILKKFSIFNFQFSKSYKIISNLPFYLTSFLIRTFLERENPPKEMILLVQKEVAQRLCAKPPKMNLLAVSVQFYAEPARNAKHSVAGGPKIISYISKNSFWPKPKVDSALIKIDNIKKPSVNSKKFFRIVKAGFSSPRKQLVNNLSKKLKIDKEKIKKALTECNLNIQARAENLSVENWISLNKRLKQPF